jgi:PEGA domain
MKKSLSLLLILLVFSPYLFSQEIKINELDIVGEGVLLSEEFISNEVRDANGNVCAGLLIQTDLAGLTFESNNGIVKSDSNPGEYLLYLSPNERVVKIRNQGFKPLQIILNDYGINLSSGKVWKLEITGEKISDRIPINFILNVDDVKIYIDNKLQSSNKNILVGKGTHLLRLEKPGYRIIADTIEVNLSNVLFPYKLSVVNPVKLTINSIPSGATVYIDDQPRGETPKQFFEFPGAHNIRLRLNGYLDHSETLILKENDDKDYKVSLIKNAGFVRISVQPKDASVSIDGSVVSSTIKELIPGQHNIEITKENHLAVLDSFKVVRGDTLQLDYALLKNLASVNLDISPTVESISINGKKVNYRRELSVIPGNNLLEIELDGYEKYTEMIQIKRGDIENRQINLLPIYGMLQVTIEPIDAKIELLKNNKVVSEWIGAKYIDSIIIGNYELRVSHGDHKEEKKNITIKKNELVKEDIELIKIDLNIPDFKLVCDNEKVTNLKLSYNNKKFTISYLINDNLDEDYEVKLLFADGRNRFEEKELFQLSGDYGEGEFASSGRNIIWDFGKEFPNGIMSDKYDLQLKLTIEEISTTWYYYVGGAILAGGVAAAIIIKPPEPEPKIPSAPDRP